ncbi:hypothetical protein [Millisia brevis]|uniref:hypothetical protein n=1 Tax=Millisia brevis TaxID=264148 RepID=UPI001C3F41FC|nr:hypothetical protein [Millisia brevis]
MTSLLGCILIASAYFDGGRQGAWFLLVAPTGLIFLAVSWFSYRRFLGAPDPLHVQALDGGVEVPIWRRQLVDLLAAILAVVIAVVWGLVTALVVGATWWPWALVLGLVAVLTAQFIRSIRRLPALTLRTDGVTYRGPTVDSFLGWDDIARIIVLEGPRGKVLVINGYPGSPSWRAKRRFWLTPIEEKGPNFGMGVEIQGPRDDRIVTVIVPLLMAYHQNPRIRSQIGTADFFALLDTQTRRADVQHYGSM